MTDLVNLLQTLIFQKVSRGAWIIIISIILQATVFRKRGGFIHRSIVSILCILATCLYGSVAVIVLNLLGREHESCRYYINFQRKMLHIFLGLDAQVEGQENLLEADQPAIYVSNHQTILDINIASLCFPKEASLVVKKSLGYYPILGWFLTLRKAIFLDRKNRGNAIKQANQVVEDMKSLNTSIFIYPEGTRSGGQELDFLPFKKGAFYMAIQAKVPIVPIVYENYKHIYDSKKKYFGHGRIKVRVIPAVSTENLLADSESVDKLSREVREKMLVAFKELSTSFENSDVKAKIN